MDEIIKEGNLVTPTKPILFHVEKKGWQTYLPGQILLIFNLEKPVKFEGRENIWILKVINEKGLEAIRADYSKALLNSFEKISENETDEPIGLAIEPESR